MDHPRGKGLFIWNIEATEKGNPVAIADKAVELGLSWVALKITDGKYIFGNNAVTASVIAALRSKGISAWGWGYQYINYEPGAEANRVIDQLEALDVDGFLIDVEHQAKQATAGEAKSFCLTLRAGTDKPLGLCSYRYPSLHPELHWQVYADVCDFHCPQGYWVEANNPASQLQRSYDELMALKEMPFIPAGVATSEGGWKPTYAQLDDFSNKAKDLGLPGIIYWVWDQAEKLGYMPTIAAQDWGVVAPEQPPVIIGEDEMEKAEYYIELAHAKGVPVEMIINVNIGTVEASYPGEVVIPEPTPEPAPDLEDWEVNLRAEFVNAPPNGLVHVQFDPDPNLTDDYGMWKNQPTLVVRKQAPPSKYGNKLNYHVDLNGYYWVPAQNIQDAGGQWLSFPAVCKDFKGNIISHWKGGFVKKEFIKLV